MQPSNWHWILLTCQTPTRPIQSLSSFRSNYWEEPGTVETVWGNSNQDIHHHHHHRARAHNVLSMTFIATMIGLQLITVLGSPGLVHVVVRRVLASRRLPGYERRETRLGWRDSPLSRFSLVRLSALSAVSANERRGPAPSSQPTENAGTGWQTFKYFVTSEEIQYKIWK